MAAGKSEVGFLGPTLAGRRGCLRRHTFRASVNEPRQFMAPSKQQLSTSSAIPPPRRPKHQDMSTVGWKFSGDAVSYLQCRQRPRRMAHGASSTLSAEFNSEAQRRS
jgi:hypothetical protein